MKILRNFVLVLMIVLGVGLCFNPVEKVHAASGVGTVKNIKKSKVKYADGKKVGGKVCYGNYRIVSWKKVKGASGYEVYRYDDLLNEWNKILTTKTNKFTVSSLLENETFTVKVCAFKKVGKSKIYGNYSNDFKYREKYYIALTSKRGKIKNCYEEGKNGYFEYASKQAFIIQNDYRIRAGVAPLVWSNELYNVSKIRSKELSKSFAHTRPDGSYCYTAFVEYFGIERCKLFRDNYSEKLNSDGDNHVVGIHNCYTENAARGCISTLTAVNCWKNSPGHYNNFIQKDIVSGSIACYESNLGEKYWISSFAYIDVDNVK